MRFNVQVEVDLDWVDDRYELDESVDQAIREEVVTQLAREVLENRGGYWNYDLVDRLDKEIKAQIANAVDKSLEDVIDKIARKKALVELMPQDVDIEALVKKEVKAIDFTALIDKAIAKRFK